MHSEAQELIQGIKNMQRMRMELKAVITLLFNNNNSLWNWYAGTTPNNEQYLNFPTTKFGGTWEISRMEKNTHGPAWKLEYAHSVEDGYTVITYSTGYEEPPAAYVQGMYEGLRYLLEGMRKEGVIFEGFLRPFLDAAKVF